MECCRWTTMHCKAEEWDIRLHPHRYHQLNWVCHRGGKEISLPLHQWWPTPLPNFSIVQNYSKEYLNAKIWLSVYASKDFGYKLMTILASPVNMLLFATRFSDWVNITCLCSFTLSNPWTWVGQNNLNMCFKFILGHNCMM